MDPLLFDDRLMLKFSINIPYTLHVTCRLELRHFGMVLIDFEGVGWVLLYAYEILAYLLMIVVGCPIILPRENESVLLGAFILGEVAAKKFSSLNEAMKAMNAAGQVHNFFFFLNSVLFLYI